MPKTKKEKLTIKDINKPKRPHLGNNIPITVFRLIRLIGMEKALPGELGNNTLYRIGLDIGKQFDITTPKELLELMRDLKIGIPSIIKQTGKKIVVQVKECVTCSGIPKVGRVLCHFEGGLIGGALSKILNKDVSVKEIKCMGGFGDDACTFEITEFFGGNLR